MKCTTIFLDVFIKNSREYAALCITGNETFLKIVPALSEDDYTRYFLDDPRFGRKIEVFALKSYLSEKLGITFKPRTEESVV